jgi:uncharacterized protein (DUF433 family)
MRNSVIQIDPQVMAGTPVFAGSRVPIATLIDYREAGESIDDFLEGFPSVPRRQVIGFLEEITERPLPRLRICWANALIGDWRGPCPTTTSGPYCRRGRLG